jgi:ABC-2 type transport system permease protein
MTKDLFTDILTVVWKEWRELFQQRSLRGGLSNWLIMVALIGIVLPLQAGPLWVTQPMILLLWAWPPILGVMWIVADSFAGERERHTLETLLASRLPDRAILFGKILMAVLYGISMEVAGLLVGLVTVNLTERGSGLLLYPAGVLAGVLVVSLLAILLVSTLGVFASLRAPTVRAAYQKMGLIFILLFLAPTILLPMIPEETMASIQRLVSGLVVDQVMLVGVAVLLVIDAALLVLAMSRFQRSRMILD